MSFPMFARPIRIFFSYATSATKDKPWFDELKKHLSNLERQGFTIEWYDSASSVGDDTGQFIETYLDNADIIVLLLSPDFFDSKRCSELEMKRAFELNKTRLTRVVPVLLRPTGYKGFPLDEYSLLPSDQRAVSERSNPKIREVLWDVANRIWKVVEEVVTKLSDNRLRSATQIPPDDIPHWPNHCFTDREALLTSVRDYFTASQTLQQTRILVLNGLAGIGKTQIAVKYVYNYKKEYQTVLWLKAASPRLLGAEIVSRAERLSLSEQDQTDEQRRFAALRRWLQEHDNWLLVLDNLEEVELISQIVPPLKDGHVILTTTTQATGPQVYTISVVQMTTDDGALFLLRRAKIIGKQDEQEATSEIHYTQARLIAQEVGGLPLALDQAGAYIDETHCTLARYLEIYSQQRATLLGKRGKFGEDHPESVAVTFRLAFDKVKQASPSALELLYLFAFLQSDAIPGEMIEQGIPALDGPLHSLATDPVELENAIAILLNFSLIQRHPNTTILSIHRVVQAILINELGRKSLRRMWAMWTVRLVNIVFPEAEFDNWSICHKYLAQAQNCAELIDNFQLAQKEAAHLLLHLGRYCYQRAYYQDAEKYLTRALELYKQKKVQDPLDTAEVLNSLASLSYEQGKYLQAEALYQNVQAIWEQELGPDHTDTAAVLNNLALVYNAQERYKEAEDIFHRVLSIDEKMVGLDHPDVAVTLNNLALVYSKQGKYQESEALFQRVLAIEQKTLSANHPDLANSLNNLASLYEKQGNYQMAGTFYQRALDIRKQNLGQKHSETAQSLNNLAGVYMKQGKQREAADLYQEALTIYKQIMVPDHPDIAKVLNNIAQLLVQQGQHEDAEKHYRQALDICEQSLGFEHSETADVLRGLGYLYLKQRRNGDAEPLLRHALTIRKQVLGPEHPDTIRSLRDLEELLNHQQHRSESDE